MPTMRINVKTHHKGPIFNASATKAAGRRMVININEAIAQEGVEMVRARLDVVLRNPTGYYRSRIAVLRRAVFRGIWDSNVVYGGWLEGVDSRNRTSRFPGYRTFRRVKQDLDSRQESIARPMVAQYVRELSA